MWCNETMIQLTPENTSRKVDSLGRIVIPSSIRKKMRIRADDELEFFALEYNDNHYICLSTGKTVDPRYSVAADVLNELGVELPDALVKAMQ